MIGWKADIGHATLENTNFRTVAYTGSHLQLTLMRIRPGDDIGREIHHGVDQFICIANGRARLELSHSPALVEEAHDLVAEDAMVIPAGIWHNVVNTGEGDLLLYSLYSSPEHAPGAVHRNRQAAMAAEHALHRPR